MWISIKLWFISIWAWLKQPFVKKPKVEFLSTLPEEQSEGFTPCVLRVRGHMLDTMVTVDIGKIDSKGNLVPDWMKMFCLVLPEEFEHSHLAQKDTQFIFIADQIPPQWSAWILEQPEAKL